MDEESGQTLYRWQALHAVHSEGNPLKTLVGKSILRGTVPDDVSSGEVCPCGAVLVGGTTVVVRVRPVAKMEKNTKKDKEISNQCVATCLVCGRESVESI